MMGLSQWILSSDTFWNVLIYIQIILESSLALWLANKQDKPWVKYTLLVVILSGFFFGAYQLFFIIDAYLLFCLARWIYRKFKS